jgi:hypothetical protein
MKSLGQVAYEGYFNHSEGKSLISGAPLPIWEGQAAKIQAAWEAAAEAVNVELSKRLIT